MQDCTGRNGIVHHARRMTRCCNISSLGQMAQASTICGIVHHARRTRAHCPTMVSSFKLSSGTVCLLGFSCRAGHIRKGKYKICGSYQVQDCTGRNGKCKSYFLHSILNNLTIFPTKCKSYFLHSIPNNFKTFSQLLIIKNKKVFPIIVSNKHKITQRHANLYLLSPSSLLQSIVFIKFF